MTIIDTHQHFWRYNPVNHAWINDDMALIRKDFLPADLQPLMAANAVTACIAVQADQTEQETDWLLQLADENSFITGVVGWVDLRSPQLAERLEHYALCKKLKGFRHILQGEDPSLMLQPDFMQGIAQLHAAGFAYDILIFPHHLPAALQLVQQFPDQRFVIDHLAKPYIKHGLIGEWAAGMKSLAAHPNVYCKISGMVTEADWRNWSAVDLHPYVDTVVQAFGTERCMFGSDWPVCLVAASYNKWLNTVQDYFASFSAEEQADVFGRNAQRFYQIDTL